MGYSNQSVINAFISRKAAKSSNGNLHTDGNKIWSYYTVIGQFKNDKTVILNGTKYSVSTSKIQTWLSYSVAQKGLSYKEVTNVPRGAYDLEKYK